jgi:hypothetical protein
LRRYNPDRAIVVLAFQTIEQIIREHFVHITVGRCRLTLSTRVESA